VRPGVSRAERLARALKGCRRVHARSRKRRVVCERQVRRRYGVKAGKKTRGRASAGGRGLSGRGL